MKFIKVQGIVIKEIHTGEADKIITIFSKKLGKIQALAKGARRPQNRLIAGTQFLCFSDFVLSKGKDIYTISSCELIESFYNIRTNIERLTYASHVVDIVSEVSEENLSYPKLTQLLLNTIHMLTSTERSPQLIIRVFEIRLMSIIGFTPEVFECTECKNVINDKVYFHPVIGGITCNNCIPRDDTAIEISKSTLDALRYIIYSDIKRVFSFDVSNSVLNELKIISNGFLSVHLNKKFRKLDFLDNLYTGDIND